MASGIGISQEASGRAFQIGQQLRRLLVERGLETADREGTPNVTPDQIESALDLSLFEVLVTSIKENDCNGDQRTEEGKPGEAA